MINAPQLTADLRRLVVRLADDMDGRVRATAAEADLQQEHRDALAHKRTGTPYVTWRRERLTQAAVAWVLACTFVRFLEDNDLLSQRRLADGHDGGRGAVAHLRAFFADRPEADERHFLRAVFEDTAALPAAAPLFDRAHNPLWRLEPGADAGAELLEFWRKRTPDGAHLVHDFTDPAWDTRFLGDLYQDLSEDIRKTYALLQTPEFVESFILDHTLTPAIATFGYARVRLIDPTCGSGHFLLGAFARLLELQRTHQPTRDPFLQTRDALAAVHGVDLNPYAVAVARFRLTVAALRACGVTRLKDAPAFPLHLAVGDSLLHGVDPRGDRAVQTELFAEFDRYAHLYAVEDREALRRILDQTYHVVVGNPPYITVKDKAANEAYRGRYTSTHRQYSLGVPFTERFFVLAQEGEPGKPAGYVGLITANSFMKREFGTKLIGTFFPRITLTHIVDTSGAYLPGHGTPTTILFGRNARPLDPPDNPVRVVMGIRGEPSTPDQPEQGLVWQAITRLIHQPGAENAYISVTDKPQRDYHQHPWSLSGGGAEVLLEHLGTATLKLAECIKEIGSGAVTREDEAYFVGHGVIMRHKLAPHGLELIEGLVLRDWGIWEPTVGIWPYDSQTLKASITPNVAKFLWPLKTNLKGRVAYGKSQIDRGLQWYEYSMFFEKRYRVPLSITFPFVATHNHFVLDRGGKVFNRTAPVIKLPEEADEAAHLALLGLLNSSTACFWMKQVFADKGNGGIGGGIGDESWEPRYEFDGTKLKLFPVAAHKPLETATALDRLGQARQALQPGVQFARHIPDADLIAALTAQDEALFRDMVFYNEELDWTCYHLYGLTDEPLTYPSDAEPVPLLPGERAFEVRMARAMAAGTYETAWFSRHGSTPITDLPAHWPDAYRRLVARRLEAMTRFKNIGLIEQPEFKRRWQRTPYLESVQKALETWLLDRIEGLAVWQADPPKLVSTGRLADWLRADAAFLQVATLNAGQEDLDLAALITRLVGDQAVPAAAACRYKSKGLDVHAAWCRTWDLQRREDALHARAALPAEHPDYLSADALAAALAEPGPIPVPPKYGQADFQSPVFWRLRGKLDVPKERFVSYPQAGPDDGSGLLVGYAGWNHLQQAAAAAAAYLDGYEQQGLPLERLMPFLAALAENLPWLRQYHNDPDPTYGTRLGDYYAGFLDEELRKHGLTLERLAAWRPSAPARGRRKKREAP